MAQLLLALVPEVLVVSRPHDRGSCPSHLEHCGAALNAESHYRRERKRGLRTGAGNLAWTGHRLRCRSGSRVHTPKCALLSLGSWENRTHELEPLPGAGHQSRSSAVASGPPSLGRYLQFPRDRSYARCPEGVAQLVEGGHPALPQKLLKRVRVESECSHNVNIAHSSARVNDNVDIFKRSHNPYEDNAIQRLPVPTQNVKVRLSWPTYSYADA